jgi:hypothetical protein
VYLPITETVFVKRSDLEILDKNVASGDQPLCDLLSFGFCNVQRDRTLVTIHADKIGTFTRIWHIGWCEATCIITRSGLLNLNNICPKIGQHLRAGRPRQHARKIEDAQPLQWPRGFSHASLRLPGTPLPVHIPCSLQTSPEAENGASVEPLRESLPRCRILRCPRIIVRA